MLLGLAELLARSRDGHLLVSGRLPLAARSVLLPRRHLGVHLRRRRLLAIQDSRLAQVLEAIHYCALINFAVLLFKSIDRNRVIEDQPAVRRAATERLKSIQTFLVRAVVLTAFVNILMPLGRFQLLYQLLGALETLLHNLVGTLVGRELLGTLQSSSAQLGSLGRHGLS